MANILVTGGAGYIGSHTTRQLMAQGHSVVVLDNLYSGHKWAIPEQALFYQGNVNDLALLDKIFTQHVIDAVIHFAGHIEVEESVRNPLKYFNNNVIGSATLIEACSAHNIKRFIFSSTAAVYGQPDKMPIHEHSALQPINPYGRSKLMTEMMLQDVSNAAKADFRCVALRYFNVAGAHLSGEIGQATPNATHLIKVASECAVGKRQQMYIHGDDYSTPDGTCVRDYIHVQDLADAHVSALEYLMQGGESQMLNCGYGEGYSVKQVIECVKQVSGIDFMVQTGPRRVGDPEQLVAGNDKIQTVLDWRPKYNDLALICKTAYEWEQKFRPQ